MSSPTFLAFRLISSNTRLAASAFLEEEERRCDGALAATRSEWSRDRLEYQNEIMGRDDVGRTWDQQDRKQQIVLANLMAMIEDDKSVEAQLARAGTVNALLAEALHKLRVGCGAAKGS